ncbi:hypothetical protein SCUCBS95973_003508 [Sporothrix curviconia]|uniref:Protein kinase domain-containing protein n=1 Tax=Sporothrix curviconia TaxID=1260050 RepID=A0ABP0BH25_9PEZI
MVYVGVGVNPVLGMCGTHHDLIRFRIIWSSSVAESIKDRMERRTAGLVTHPDYAQTIDDTGTMNEPGMAMRLRTLRNNTRLPMRYRQLEELGNGTFGHVYKALDYDSGKHMAVKVIFRKPGQTNKSWAKMHREVKNLDHTNHKHIIGLIWSQDWDTPKAEIFLSLKHGNLGDLARQHRQDSRDQIVALCNTMFFHMLQALDYLQYNGLIHRDVKPDNILYTLNQGVYEFCLGDFGVSSTIHCAKTFSGTTAYMAPEVAFHKTQTPKVDVSSLYATILSVLNEGCYNDMDMNEQLANYPVVQDTILRIAADKTKADLYPLRFMAAQDPVQRASAAQMLCLLFQGVGLTTPRHKVTPIKTET